MRAEARRRRAARATALGLDPRARRRMRPQRLGHDVAGPASRGSSEPTGSWKTTCIVAPQLAQRRALRAAEHVRARRTRSSPRVDIDEAQEAAGERRLARAGLADQAVDLARRDVEVDPRDRADGSRCRRPWNRLTRPRTRSERRDQSPRSATARPVPAAGTPTRRAGARHWASCAGRSERWQAADGPHRRLAQQRPLDAAAIEGDRAAVGEGAAGQRARCPRAPTPGSVRSGPPRRASAWHRRQQPPRVGMLRRREQRVGRSPSPRPVPRTAPRPGRTRLRTTPRSWVMSITLKPASSLEPPEELQDLGRDGHVERRWSARRRSAGAAGTAAPSRSSPAGACRPRAGADRRASPGRRRAARPPRAPRGCAPRPRAAGCRSCAAEHVAASARRCEHGVERRRRVLEDHRDSAPRSAQLGRPAGQQVPAVEPDAAAS